MVRFRRLRQYSIAKNSRNNTLSVHNTDIYNDSSDNNDQSIKLNFRIDSLTSKTKITQTEFPITHSYIPFDMNGAPSPDYTEKLTLKSGDLKKLSALHRFDVKSLSYGASKRRKLGRCHHNFSYFNLSGKSSSTFVSQNTLPICICIDGKIEILNENSMREIAQMLPSLSLPSNIPSTSSCNALNDYSLSSVFSNQNSNEFDDYLKVVRNLSPAIITGKGSNYKLRHANRGMRHLQRHLNSLNPDSDYKDDSLTASATFHIYDKAESSITVHESKTSPIIPFNTMLDDLQDLSIENDKNIIQILPENITEQDDICKKLAGLPLTDQCEMSRHPVSPSSIFSASFSSPESDKSDFTFLENFQQNQITSGVERLKF